MEKILSTKKEYLAKVEEEKLSLMTNEEKEQYKWSKQNWMLSNTIKFERDKEKDGEAIDIFEYNWFFLMIDYL
jgi:UDP-N-acetylmuramyl pentapeptide synthase